MARRPKRAPAPPVTAETKPAAEVGISQADVNPAPPAAAGKTDAPPAEDKETKPAAASLYEVMTPIRMDGEKIAAGETLELSDSQARAWLRCRAIQPARR